MKKIFVGILFVIIFFVSSLSVFSQVVADFSPQFYEACANANILFTNTTTGCNGQISYYWQSGAGAYSTLKNPTFSYSTGGTYTVLLTVSCDGQQYTVQKDIIIHNLPDAKFINTHVEGCAPFTVNFNNLSTSADAPIVSYFWDFHDGNTSNIQNPTHTFNVYGIYSIFLEVTDANGCTNNFSETDMVTVSATPIVNFSATPTNACYIPLNVNFNQSVSTYNNQSYSVVWNFGDGTNVTQNNPSHTYNSFGNYNVTLTVTDASGCVANCVKNNFVKIGDIPAAYTILTGNDTVCKNTSVIIQNATNLDSEWHYEGQTSYSNILNLSYSTSGNHYITFISDPNGPCRDEITFPIFVEQVDVSFDMVPDQTIFCNPTSIQFINTSSSNVAAFSYQPGNSPFPIAGITSPTVFYNEGIYTPSLLGTTAFGCSETFTGHQFQVFDDTIDFAINASHCISEMVTFEYSGFDFPYTWVDNSTWFTNPDGIFANNVASVNKFYDTPGSYTITLTVTTIYGCVFTKTRIFTEGTPYYPEILDIFPPASDTTMCFCDSWQAIIAYNHDTCDYNCNSSPSVGVATISPTPNDIYLYIRSFSYVHNGCVTNNIVDTVYINPPAVYYISDITSCANHKQHKFIAVAEGADYFDWTIEDIYNNLIYNEITYDSLLIFNFLDNGNYTITATAYNNNTTDCVCSSTTNINVTGPIASIEKTADTVCVNNDVHFYPHNLDEFGYISFVFWNFGDGTSSNYLDPTHTYTTAGNYTVTLIIWDYFGCPDTTTTVVVVPYIDINVLAENNNGCINLLTTFYNATSTNDQIQTITWMFHDGTIAIGDTSEFFYPNVGVYSFVFFITTKHNCVKNKTFGNFVHVSDVDSNFMISPNVVCAGEEVTFTAVEQAANVSYSWNYGAGIQTIQNNNNFSYTYQNGGYYDVTLTATSNFGCSRSKTIPNAVRVEKINSYFFLTQNNIKCYPAGIDLNPFINVEPNNIDVSYFWNFGTTENSDLLKPVYTYDKPGIYNILFITTTPNGCVDSCSQNVVINGPIADIYVSDTLTCIGNKIDFKIVNTQNVSEFLWVLGDGASSTQNSFSYTYNYYPPNGFVIVVLKLYSINNNDTCQVFLQKKIYIDNVIPDFSILDEQNNVVSENCSPLNSILHSNSQNESERTWFINGQQLGNNQNENYSFVNNTQNIKEFSVKLFSFSPIGCLDSLSKNITILPVPNLVVSKDITICPNDSIKIFANGALNYSWSPNYNISDTTIPNPTVYPLETTNYEIYGTNQYNCLSTNNIIVSVQENVFSDITNTEIKINAGECFDFDLLSSQDNAIYSWTPNYNISCIDCQNPSICPLQDTTYFLTISDSLQCFINNYSIFFNVRQIFTIDVPTAFTPLSDDGNNIVYVRGYGIKKLKYFRIFNRWGEEVFYTDNINIGWDGKYKGVIQNIDNYAFMVEAEMYNGSIALKKGIIMLIK